MKNILIINVNWLGDALFSTPFIKAVRKKYPSSHIAVMAVPRVHPMLELNPNIDEIIAYGEEGRHKSLLGKARLITLLRSKKFDTCFILHRSFTKVLIAYLSGIKMRVGYKTKKRAALLSYAIDEPSEGVHKVEYFLNIAGSCGIDVTDKDYEFFAGADNRERVRKLLAAEGVSGKDKLVVLNPGGNWDLKRWPKESFAKLADLLINALDVKVVISGAEKDCGLANDILSGMKNKALSVCGRISLKELGALAERADLVISGDSGPMHIAVSMKTPVIAIFGPTSPELTGPYGSGNYVVLSEDIGCDVPCYNDTCSDNRCMKAITSEAVFNKAKEMLVGESRGAPMCAPPKG